MKRRGTSPSNPPPGDVRRAACDFVREALAAHGLEPRPEAEGGVLLVEWGGRLARLRVLGATAPHLRGGRGNLLGLHWMLTDPEADFAALVDLSRRRGWLLPVDDFRRRAQMLPGLRFHLDWIVARLGPSRSRVADEAEFDEYRLEEALRRYFPEPAG